MDWKEKAIKLLTDSLHPVPAELNELDWKSGLSDKSDRLAQHISAFANLKGGGFWFTVSITMGRVSICKKTKSMPLYKNWET